LSFVFFIFVGLVAVLLVLLIWSLRGDRKRTPTVEEAASLEESGRRHVTYLPQVRQALSPVDFAFLASRGSAKLSRRVRKERYHIARSYLSALRRDFEKLLRLARIIAILSPEVGAAQEYERLRLQLRFSWHYQMIRARLFLGFAPLPQLHGLGQMVSALGIHLELAMKELGERAAIAAEMASSPDRSGMHLT
jgi:hypothetical protein